MGNQFIGMMITLKKRMACINVDDTLDSRYLMFGHYDGIDITCVNEWYQLRPKGVAQAGGNVDIEDAYWDKYTFKLYFPECDRCIALNQKGFAYDIWEKLGFYHDFSKECEHFLESDPFISIAMINLSEKCVAEGQDLLEKMQNIVSEAAQKASVNLKDIHCAIMPSIGYADFVLLFLCDNLKNVVKVLDYLREASIENHGRSYAVVSNSYAISGFARAGLKNLHNLNGMEDVKLSIRVNLRDGVSPSQFKKYFEEELEKVLKNDAQNDAQVKKPLHLYQVFGNSDCLILSDMPFDFFIPLFYDAKLLNPRHELFVSYIQYTRSSIRVMIDSAEVLSVVDRDRKAIYDKYKRKFKDLIDKLTTFVKKYDLPIRTVNGIQTVMKAYLNLIQFSHCFEIEKIIGTAFEAVTNNVEKTLKFIEDDEKKDNRKKDDGRKACWYCQQMMAALGIFREKIEDYLADLHRSDRLFIEGQSLSHPSIGSATKLLFFYNQYINDIAEKLVKTEESGESKRFTFVVTSGGCDVTTAYDLFSYLDPVSELEHSLIIISIPEMSLYDFRGTMFRLLHECFHFCGERKRVERLGLLFKSLSANTALVISNGLCKSIESQLIRLYASLKKHLSPKDMSWLRKQGKQILQQEIKNLEYKLEEKIFSGLETIFNKKDPTLYFGRNMYPEVIENLKGVIWEPDEIERQDSFLHYTYHEMILCQNAIADKLILRLNERSVPFSKANILKETSAQKLEMERDGKFDMEEEALIRAIWRNYTESVSYEKELVNINEEERTTVEEVVLVLQDLFKECFADCMAAEILNLSIEDFLLCFLYETWNYKNAFPDMFRIAMELKVLYGVQGKLDVETCQRIREKVQHWENRGFQYRHNNVQYTEDVCNWLNKLLEDYEGIGNSQYVGMDSVEEYLDQCVNYYKKYCSNKFFAEVEEISNLSNMNSLGDLYRLLEKVRRTKNDRGEAGKDYI